MDLITEALRALPGCLGSLFAMLFFREPDLLRSAGFFLAGGTTAWYSYAWVASRSGVSEGLASFLVGLFSMAIVRKLFDIWDKFDLGSIIVEWVRKLFGLPVKS